MRPLNTSTDLGKAFTKVGLGSNRPITPFYVAMYFFEYGNLAKASEGGQRRVMTAFQSLLSIPIYYCQAVSAYQVKGLGSNIAFPLVDFVLSKLPGVQPDTRIVPAKMSYSVTLTLRALIPFTVIGGITLLLCFMALTLSSRNYARNSMSDAETFYLLAHDTKIQIVDEEDVPVTEEDRRRIASWSTKEKLCEAGTWRVTLL
jgi:hypothetical protein